MASRHIKSTWITLEDGGRGTERVLNIATDLVVNVRQPGYDGQKFTDLVREAGILLSGTQADHVVFHGKNGSLKGHKARSDPLT
jgi:hypothetical protein